MKFEALEVSWQIVLVVTAQNVDLLPHTLDDVRVRSFSSEISVLATDHPAVRNALSDFSLPVEYALPATIEQGSYWISVISSHKFLDRRTIFLLAGTRVPEHWDARLVAAGQRANNAIAISPQCVRHPILSAFTSSDHEPKLKVEEVDQWLNDYAKGIEFTVPVMLESCLLLQGDYWRQPVPECSNDGELLDALRQHGKYILATDQVYVDDAKTNYSRDISFLPTAFSAAYTRRHPLAETRHALTELSSRAEKPAEIRHCLPFVLHVGHSWGGGLSRWIRNYIEADTSHHHIVLMSIGDRTAFGQQIALYLGPEMRVPLRTWILSEPIQSVVITQYEYSQLLQEIIKEFSVESIIISSLIGHSMDLLQLDIPVTNVLHDFFPFCPALYATYGDPCISCKPNELRQCAKLNPLHSYFKNESDEHWLQVRAFFLARIQESKVSLISPSRSVVERYLALEESLRHRDIQVIEHGLSHDLIESLSVVRDGIKPSTENRLRIVILGRLAPEKGSALLAEFIEELGKFADIWLLGAGENGQQFEGRPKVTVIQEYSTLDLSAHLKSISAHLGLLLSIVPETFSYTLSELWAAGIPVLATRLGAFSDRIIDGENGWLAPINAEQILKRIKQLNEDRNSLALTRERIIKRPIRQTSDMVKDYQLHQRNLGYIPLGRYFLPRKTYLNPYRKPVQQVPKSVLFIDRQATYRSVLQEFLVYSTQKIDHTPRLSAGFRSIFKRIMDICLAALSTQKNKE